MNLILPGNPRYQPRSLVPYFGYDNLVKPQIEVELALLYTLKEVSMMSASTYGLLTPQVREHCMQITTTMVDERERGRRARSVTHELCIAALKAILPEDLQYCVPLFEYCGEIFDCKNPHAWFENTVEAVHNFQESTSSGYPDAESFRMFASEFTEEINLQTGRVVGTRHDIRALVELIKERLPEPLRKWVHSGATSYDIIHTASIFNFKRAWQNVTATALDKLISVIAAKVEKYADVRQIGRTHGQHAIPITVGFWLATLLYRLLLCRDQLRVAERGLVGKFSGAVGAYNAITLLQGNPQAFEEILLVALGLSPAPISTQILPPEPLALFLHANVLLSGALGQIGRDCRNLQRSEIGEIREKYEEGQTGSSTMAQKRNPITFEGTEGLFIIVKDEYHKVLDTLISEHQRDLVGSSVMREFPGIVVLTQYQIERLFPSIETMEVDIRALKRNLRASIPTFMAEALQIALQIAGYDGDAHAFVNHTLVPRATRRKSIMVICEEMAQSDQNLASVLDRIPEDIRKALHRPLDYVGIASYKARNIVRMI